MSLLSSIGNAISGAAHQVGGLAGEAIGAVAGKAVGKAVGNLAADVVEKAVSTVVDGAKTFTKLAGLWSQFNGTLAHIAEDAAGALLPRELQKVKELVGAAVNLYTGNYPGLIENGLHLLANSQQTSQNLSKLSPNLSPSPPPPPPPPSSPAGAASAAGTQASSAGSTAASGKTDSVNGSKGKEAAQAFLSAHSNPEDFMEQIRKGNIPEDVLNSQAGMMMIQERLQSIQQMNQLMTQMLKSMHDMSMAIVQNVRV